MNVKPLSNTPRFGQTNTNRRTFLRTGLAASPALLAATAVASKPATAQVLQIPHEIVNRPIGTWERLPNCGPFMAKFLPQRSGMVHGDARFWLSAENQLMASTNPYQAFLRDPDSYRYAGEWQSFNLNTKQPVLNFDADDKGAYVIARDYKTDTYGAFGTYVDDKDPNNLTRRLESGVEILGRKRQGPDNEGASSYINDVVINIPRHSLRIPTLADEQGNQVFVYNSKTKQEEPLKLETGQKITLFSTPNPTIKAKYGIDQLDEYSIEKIVYPNGIGAFRLTTPERIYDITNNSGGIDIATKYNTEKPIYADNGIDGTGALLDLMEKPDVAANKIAAKDVPQLVQLWKTPFSQVMGVGEQAWYSGSFRNYVPNGVMKDWDRSPSNPFKVEYKETPFDNRRAGEDTRPRY